MFPLVETIRYDNGVLHNLDLHEERLNRSRNELYDDLNPISLADEIIRPDIVNENETYKVRVLYGKRVGYIEWLPYSITPIETFALINANDLDYHLKYTDRSALTTLNKQKGDADSFIVVQDDMITDMSYGNLLFYRGKRWITPSTPLLKGVMREQLLRSNQITEEPIFVDDLNTFEKFTFVNAMIPLEKATILPMNAIKG